MQIAAPPVAMKANPTLQTLHEVERILRDEYAQHALPLSYAEIGRRMAAKRVRFEVIRECVMELARLRLVAVGSDGVNWIVQDPRARKSRHVPLA